MKATRIAAASLVALLAGCSASTPRNPPASTSAAPGGHASPVSATWQPAAAVEPVTKAAAKTAAETYFALYGAGQYAAVYPMIDPGDRAQIPSTSGPRCTTKCHKSTGLTYAVKHPVLAGHTAVVSVGFAGAAAPLGSEQVTFVYVSGKWYYQPSDMSVYAHHNVAQAVAAAKAAGVC